jgi:hypothetical protein
MPREKPFASAQGKKESAARDVFMAGFKPRPSTRDEDLFERGIGRGSRPHSVKPFARHRR